MVHTSCNKSLLISNIYVSPREHVYYCSVSTYYVCVFYYCRTYYKAVRVGGGGEWRTCAMRDDEPRPVWMSLLCVYYCSTYYKAVREGGVLITHWDP